MKKSILDYFPEGMTPRDVQAKVLFEVERRWNQYDVFVINAPVALGKSAIAATIANWAGRARICTPTNILVDQYSQLIPTAVKSAGQYMCDMQKTPCSNVKNTLKKYCKECPYPGQFRKGKEEKITVSTYHMLTAMRGQKKVHIFDEAHNLIHYLREQHTKKLWPHKYGVPDYCLNNWNKTRGWLSSQLELPEEMEIMLTELYEENPLYIYEYGDDIWKGGGIVNGTHHPRGEEVMTDIIKRYPINIKLLNNPLWKPEPQGQKLILMSATIGKVDLKELGLDRRRTRLIDAGSPIPKENRPIHKDYVGNINYGNIGVMLDRVIDKIDYMLRNRGEKGFIHMPYSMASRLRQRYGNDRLLFHDKTNTAEVLKEFKQSSDKVMVGSGLYEGVSLDYELARWQIISKVPWPSLASPLQRYWVKHDQDYYSWSALKSMMQASGRVCRSPTDYGETIVLDGSFDRLHSHHLAPKWFREAVV